MPVEATHENGVQIAYIPLGHVQVSVGTTVVALPSLPARDRIRRVTIRVLGQPINFRDDGVDPTGAVGFPLLADETLVYDGDPELFRMRTDSTATGNADVRIAYYGT
jgi:hypothetical protein